jgi:hypothetical protein
MLTILQSSNLKLLQGLRHAFFGRTGGVSQGIYDSLNCGSLGDDPQSIEENRRRVAAHLEAKPECLLSCKQIHSPDVVVATQPWPWHERPEADAMVTRERGIALGVLTADCVPILFVDIEAGVIGAAHAGWRGALGGVIENTIAAMEKIGATRPHTVVALGPCIGQDSYEVGPEFPEAFLKENPHHQKYFRPSERGGHSMFNLPAYVESRLRAAEVMSVDPSPADTCANPSRFFSYRYNTLRGNKRAGSLISTVMLA